VSVVVVDVVVVVVVVLEVDVVVSFTSFVTQPAIRVSRIRRVILLFISYLFRFVGINICSYLYMWCLTFFLVELF